MFLDNEVTTFNWMLWLAATQNGSVWRENDALRIELPGGHAAIWRCSPDEVEAEYAAAIAFIKQIKEVYHEISTVCTK